MCTIDMNGSRVKEKKLLLTTNKKDFCKRMIFHNDEEILSCNKYLDLKGVSYHVILANYVGLNRNGNIEYKKVQNIYIYDKRIRNILYKFLAALEEGVRGYISNQYSSNTKQLESVSKVFYRKVNSGNTLSKELENLTFGSLIQLVKKLPNSQKLELFGYTENLSMNLDAVKELRNTVSHHRMLFVYEDFLDCFVTKHNVGNSLDVNIINLHDLLDTYYQKFFKDAINNSRLDKTDKQFVYKLPKSTLISI